MKCHCCSGLNFTNCCQPFLAGTIKAETAESLMRSRYSAYVVADVNYIIATTHLSTRKMYDPNSIKQWAKSSIWQKLDIISKQEGEASDCVGKVEFKAYYLDSNKRAQVHHEHSNFAKENGVWFFVDGRVH
jgi:SEC-C motif-containing protein